MADYSQTTTGEASSYYAGVPEYMIEVYDWAYVNPRNAGWLDRNFVVKTLLFLQDQRQIRAYLDEIEPGMRVWQLAHVYGDLVRRAADRVGPTGAFHLTDITPVQVEHGRKKLAGRPWAKVFSHDAATFTGEGEPYDLICSFHLMHEVPDDKKRQILDRMLSMLPKHGKLVFIDYHRPAWWQPIRWILKVINAWLEPFAHAIWQHEIRDFASKADQFDWQKRTIFGGVYQIVVVRHKHE